MTTALLSASTAHTIYTRTPWHAWTEHPVLNPNYEREESDQLDLGNVSHGCLLTGDANVVLVEAPDWRSKAAKEARAAARAEGKTPLLAHRWAEVQAMVKAAREQLPAHEPPTPFTAGVAEESLYFDLDGVACRATPDWRHRDNRTVDDYKTTSASAHPAVWAKTIWSSGNAIQAAFYRRAVKAVYGVTPDFRFIVQETYPPFALAVVSLDPEALALADAQVTEALALWKDCLATNRWPGYITRTAYAEAPGWAHTEFAERGYYREHQLQTR